jgi:hypothetical protein
VHGNPQLLVQLPYHRLLGPFALLNLSARKFPQASHGLACRALSDQDATIRVKESASGNKDEFHAHTLAAGV